MNFNKHGPYRGIQNRAAKFEDMAKVGRQEAREIGQRFYWKGEPCSHGHTDWRYVENCRCVTCQNRSVTAIKNRKAYGDSSAMREIDRHNEDVRLRNELKEVWDD